LAQSQREIETLPLGGGYIALCGEMNDANGSARSRQNAPVV